MAKKPWWRDGDQRLRDEFDAKIGICIDQMDFAGMFNQNFYMDESIATIAAYAKFLIGEKKNPRLKGREIVQRFHELQYFGADPEGKPPEKLHSFWNAYIKNDKISKKRRFF